MEKKNSKKNQKKTVAKVTLISGEKFNVNRQLKGREKEEQIDQQIKEFEEQSLDGEIGLMLKNSFGS